MDILNNEVKVSKDKKQLSVASQLPDEIGDVETIHIEEKSYIEVEND